MTDCIISVFTLNPATKKRIILYLIEGECNEGGFQKQTNKTGSSSQNFTVWRLFCTSTPNWSVFYRKYAVLSNQNKSLNFRFTSRIKIR
jgi:hypothetical protein